MRAAPLLLIAGCNWAFGISEQPVPDAPPPGRWASVAISARHACAIDLDQQLYCWGDPANGRLGTAGSTTPHRVGADRWLAVATGHDHSCAIDTTGRAWCWGSDAFGQVTGGGGGDQSAPVPVAMPVDHPVFTAIATSFVGSCALGGDGRVFCWGDPGSAKGSTSTSRAAEAIASSASFTQLAMGLDHACALASTGDVWCWGSNGAAQTGQPATAQSAPAIVPIGKATAIGAGTVASCAILATDEVWCWGGSAVVSHDFIATPPTRVLAGAFTQIAVGSNVACAIAGGQVSCWGYAQHGGLGAGRFADDVAASAIATTRPADAISLSAALTGEESGCALANHELACWGDNRGGQLGGTATLHTAPVAIAGTWRRLAVGADHTCARDDAGHLSCWGADDAGQSTGTPGADAATPTAPLVATASDDVIAGNDFTCARSDRAIDCWGSNAHGAMLASDPGAHAGHLDLTGAAHRVLLGGGGGACITNPVQCWGFVEPGGDAAVPTGPADPNMVIGAEPLQLQLGAQTNCELTADRKRVCWGYGYHGQLGDGTDAPGNASAAIPMFNDPRNYSDLSLLAEHACATGADDGNVYCWGTNYSFESGPQIKSAQVVLTPTPIASSSGPLAACTKAAAGNAFSCAVCGNAVDCWGSNTDGELGRASLTPRLDGVAAPVMLATSAWNDVGAGTTHACAIANDGSLACWGLSDRGQVGDGSRGSATPVAIVHP